MERGKENETKAGHLHSESIVTKRKKRVIPMMEAVKISALCLAFLLGTAVPSYANPADPAAAADSAAADPADESHAPAFWQQTDAGRFLLMEDGGALTGWQQQDGLWYYLAQDGLMKTGWLQEGDDWYYLGENGAMVSGWQWIDGKHYYFRENGAMQSSTLRKDGTQYTFGADGSLAGARKEKNTGGGSYPIAFFDEDLQAMADSLNELKADDFDGDEEEDYYEDDKKNYDKDASFILNGRLQEIAEHRLEAARTKGYGSGRIPDEGTLEDYLKAIRYNSGRRVMEVYLINCDGVSQAEEKLLRNHDSDEKKRSDRAVYYKEMGIAHEKVNEKDYFMIIFMR